MRVILFIFLVINPLSWIVAWYDLKKNAGPYWKMLDFRFKLFIILQNLWKYVKL